MYVLMSLVTIVYVLFPGNQMLVDCVEHCLNHESSVKLGLGLYLGYVWFLGNLRENKVKKKWKEIKSERK